MSLLWLLSLHPTFTISAVSASSPPYLLKNSSKVTHSLPTSKIIKLKHANMSNVLLHILLLYGYSPSDYNSTGRVIRTCYLTCKYWHFNLQAEQSINVLSKYFNFRFWYLLLVHIFGRLKCILSDKSCESNICSVVLLCDWMERQKSSSTSVQNWYFHHSVIALMTRH